MFSVKTHRTRYALLLTVVLSSHAAAQLDPTGRSGDRPREFLPQDKKTLPAPRTVLPPISPPAKTEREGDLPPQRRSVLPPLEDMPENRIPGPRVMVQKIKIIGNTVFSAQELAHIIDPYENRELSTEDLESLRLALTRFYISKGYINSGAVIPDQIVTDGVVTFEIVEGNLTRVEIEENEWLRDAYIRNRIRLDAGPPLNINALQERLQLLLQNVNIDSLHAELQPGIERGDSVLKVRVKDRQPFELWTEYNNYQSPTVGADRGLVTFIDRSVTGFSDTFYFQYGRSTGLNPLIDVFYRAPFTPYDTSLRFRYRKNDYGVVESPFDPLNINTTSEIFGITLRQPFLRSLNQEFALELIGQRLSSNSTLLGKGFSFTPGTHNGKAVTAPIRFAQEWIRRTQAQVFATRFQFSFGTRALGATKNESSSLPDAEFFAWLAQFQWARRLPFWDIVTLWRTNLQLSADPLFPLEQISIGGRYSVRGYRENTLVRDNGFINQIEIRIPIIQGRPWADYVQLAPFIDVGTGWNDKIQPPGPKTIASVGIGVRWALTKERKLGTRSEFEFYWGAALNSVNTPGGDLQDHGIHLRFAVGFF